MVTNNSRVIATVLGRKIVPHSIKLREHVYLEAYSAAGGMGFGWWLVEHYLSYHVDCPDGCGLGGDGRGWIVFAILSGGLWIVR